MHIVSDVHGADGALARLAPEGSTVLVLGDLVNLIDYRTNAGIVTDVVGEGLVRRVVELRTQLRFDEASALWRRENAERFDEIKARVGRAMREEYEAVAQSLERYVAFVTFGNVDDPIMLKDTLPSSATFVDSRVIEIDGYAVGFAGGGVPSIGSAGEVSTEEMASKLATLGPVDILCTHVPPAVGVLSSDVIGGRAKGSEPILEYLMEHQPAFHYFGDVHQPTASRWRVGDTICINVGYFRATGRGIEHV
jgi:Icc-related predicted phosphoesterase